MRTDIQPGFIALHGNRTESLADTVLAWLRQCPLDPLEEEVILVQSNGMAEWLKMLLARRGSVCAATRVELPARFLWRTYRQVLGRAHVPPDSPLDKAALTWRLMRLLPDLLREPGFEPVADFLRDGESDRLFQLAGRLADLLDGYQVYRADWLDDWAAGRDQLLAPGRPALAIPPDQRWQPMLWRALLAGLSEGQQATARPRLHRQVLETLNSGAALASPVARRVILFGMSAVPLATLQLMAALARHSQVMLAVPNPCRFHWADIMDGRELLRLRQRRQPLRGGRDLAELSLEEMHAHAHPLLAAWGRQGRDFVRQLDEFDDAQQARELFALPRIDLFDEDEAPDAPLLTQVQNRIRDLVPLAEHPPRAVDPADRSIVFHVAHGALREIEILHDQLLQLFAEPPGGRPLHPRDVVVMVPDIETLAPAIRAVFGQYRRHDPRHIPFDITDLSARAGSPLLAALEWLLHLPQQRARLSELRDLLDVPAVAARFGIDADALERLTHWMAGAGIRWGLTEAQRETLGLGACGEQNTGWFGLRRMLLGYASGAGRLEGAADGQDAASFRGIEPYAEVGGLEAELAGALASVLDRLLRWWRTASTPASPAEWAVRARALLADMVRPVDEADRQTLTALDEALTAWQEDCAQGGFEAAVPLTVMREAWLDTLEAPSLDQRFRAGGVTFCTLMPMRAIPFEVVALLGMNDGDYPRRAPRSDFDLMGLPGQGRPGDRSRRDDDRQLMLEALLSARRVLYVSWTGHSVRDNSEQPPSVLVSQLRDYLAAGWTGDVLKDRTTHHPLQPFSRRYFEPGTELFTHAREWRAAHADDAPEAAVQAAPSLPPFEPDPHVPLTVARLVSFLRNPVKAFFRQRLNVVFDEDEEEGADEESFGLAGLEAYGLLRELLHDVVSDLASAPADGVVDAAGRLALRVQRVQRAGRLPLASLGARAVAQIQAELAPQLQAWQAAFGQHPVPAPRRRLHFEHGGVVLEDWLDQLRAPPRTGELPAWLELDPSRVVADAEAQAARPERMVAPWVRSLVAAACGVEVQGVVVGRDATVILEPMPPESARATLALLIDTWRQGLDAPLPLPQKTALAQVRERKPAEAYHGSHGHEGEGQEACLRRVFPDFEALAADGQFEALASSVYAPLIEWLASHSSMALHEPAPQAKEGATP